LFLFRTEFVFIDIFQEGGIKNLAEFTFSATSEADVNNALGLSTNIKNISQALFKNYLFHFILAGFVLLLAMVAAIVLTVPGWQARVRNESEGRAPPTDLDLL